MGNRTIRLLMSTALTALTLAMGAGSLQAFVKPGGPIGPGDTPDYLTSPNWAYSPPLRKFIDPLPLLAPQAGALKTPGGDPAGQYIPVAVPDIVSYPGSDYYVIELRQFTEKMHSDLEPTTLRGYMQTNLGTNTSACTDPSLGQPNPCSGAQNTVVAQTHPHYLGPLIISQKDRPVRVKFINKLPTGAGGDLFIPVDQTIMGAGPFQIDYDPVTKQPTATKSGVFTQNRGELHLHGGRTPWISDGTPHQWITPAGETTDYPTGVSVENVPDMPDPGPGAQTYYWTNQQSSRMLFYHDHSWGITRLNVYVGGAAGYLIEDPVEKALVAAGTIPADQIPLVIQDKTYVDPATIAATDPTWNWGTNTKGDLWWPHVYMPAQNPFDITGIAPMGRWAYGPYFWPATNNPYQPVPNPYYNASCDPEFDPTPGDGLTQADIDANTASIAGYSSIQGVPYCQPPEIPSTPNPSWGAEAFMDTPIVNGTAYPVMTVDPKPYRLRVLNAAHDRFFNLQMYEADGTVDPNADPNSSALCSSLGGCATNTEVKMLPAIDYSADPTWPTTWPADVRPGGIPDWTKAGPSWIMIGSEGGFLPKPVVIPNQPVNWNVDVTTFNAGNVNAGSLILGPAERADVIVDFSQYAGKTLILYNDAPAPWPALDPHYDYYTDPALDNTAMGGAGPTVAGVGPNTRTIMQIKVGTNNQAAFNLANLNAAFTPANPATPGVFKQSQDPLIVGQGDMNSAGDPAKYEAFPFDGFKYDAINKVYNANFPNKYPNWGVGRINDKVIYFTGTDGSTTYNYNPADTTPLPWDNTKRTYGGLPMKFKAIQDEQGETFDDYGRMRAALGLELITPGAGRVNFIVQTYSDPSTEILEENGIQVWKITHNGVDTHPVHFHLFDVQVLNRVGWDGFIRLPDPTEQGWKDTVRISPLEDTVVALKPVTPKVPFGVPESYRPKNPATPLNDNTELSMVDPTTGQAWATPNINAFINLKWEYVWHCHILSHEENDMMRPMQFNFVSAAPAAPVLNSVSESAALAWSDPTPANPANLGNPANEIAFKIQRCSGTCDNNGSFSEVGKALANSTSFVDTTAAATTTYSYRVAAFNAAGETLSNIVTVTTGTQVLPTVTLTSPANGASFYTPATITLSATVVGAAEITGVDFYNGATLLGAGTLSGGVYSFDWTNVPVGTYSLIARVTASLGATADSPAITVSVLGISTASLPDGSVNSAYNHTMAIAGGTAPFTWSATGLPSGLSIDPSTGVISGTPPPGAVQAGTSSVYTVNVSVQDSAGTPWTTNATLSLRINQSAPAAPSGLTASAAPSNQAEVVLTWADNANNETGVQIQRALDNTFTTGLATAILNGTNLTTYTDTTVTPATTYYYRVQAVNVASVTPAYSNVVSVIITYANSPASLWVRTATPSLTNPVVWGASATPNVTYELQEATNSDFTANVRQVYSGTALRTDVTVAVNGTYYYRVRALATGFLPSTWVNSLASVVTAPTSKPASLWVRTATTVLINPVVWGASATPNVTYELQEATNSDFTANVRQVYSGTALRTDVTVAVNGTYYYRVRATAAGMSPSTWVNSLASVVTAPPPAFKPASLWVRTATMVLTNPVVWGASATPNVTYELQEATNSDFTANVRQVYSGTALRTDVTVAVNGTYYYRVRATAAGMSPSTWVNSLASVVTAPTSKPASLWVRTATTVLTNPVVWGASATPNVTYELQEATNGDFTANVRQVYSGTALRTDVTVAVNGTYYYRVRATAAGMSPSTWVSSLASVVTAP